MIDLFRNWLPQIIGYAEVVQDGSLEKAWADGDHSHLIVYYSGELYEQVFGDLHAEAILLEAQQQLREHPHLLETLNSFLHALKRLDAWIEVHVDTDTWGRGKTIPSNVRSIVQSEEWREVQSSASSLLAAAGEAGFSSEDFDPTS